MTTNFFCDILCGKGVEFMTYISPFNVSFGEQPKCFIPRENEFSEIVSVFSSTDPRSKVYLIGGPRGCGKTVLLSEIKEYFDNKEDWITLDLNPFFDMLEQFASKLYSEGKMKHLFLKTEFSFSFYGLSFSISGDNQVTDITSLIKTMLQYLKKKGKRVLITIDDVSGNDQMKIFVQTYQSLIREKFDVFLLMTGLYENVSSISNDKNLTFLLRAPKLYLQKLSLRGIASSYETQLSISYDDSIKMAKLTNGYAYAYQLLGDLLYRSETKIVNKEILDKYDSALEDNVYAKIWSTLPQKQKLMAYAIASSKSCDIKEIISITGFSNSEIQVYKKRMTLAGIVDDSTRGKIEFLLPRFKEFVEFQKALEDF